MGKAKIFFLIGIFSLGVINCIFFTDSRISGLYFLDIKVWGKMLLLLTPIAFLYSYLLRPLEAVCANYFEKNRIQEGDSFNSTNIALMALSLFIVCLIFLSMYVVTNLNRKYNAYYVDKEYTEPNLSYIKNIATHRDLTDHQSLGDTATEVSYIDFVTDEEKKYRVACSYVENIPDEILIKLVKIRVSDRNEDYFYPICPTDEEISDAKNQKKK